MRTDRLTTIFSLYKTASSYVATYIYYNYIPYNLKLLRTKILWISWLLKQTNAIILSLKIS